MNTDDEKTGTWECPSCGREHDDHPLQETMCYCGQAVTLSDIDDDGRIEAYPDVMFEPMPEHFQYPIPEQ